ncbi:uncharacterized protein PG986_011668 [Apiospora aurea]|uniref:Heterokaryon incompatibility domain-containing protein n=1 Tax=Apiospora aurea TaxID=335848 RepID=A0ABR1PXU1_9PEZI
MDHLSHLILGRQTSGQSNWPPIMPVYAVRDDRMSDQVSSFPRSVVIDEDEVIQLLGSNEMEDRCLGHAQLQAWSYFGIIRHVFGANGDPIQTGRPYGASSLDSYMQAIQGNGLLRFDTTNLRAMVEAWVQDTRAQPSTDSLKLHWHEQVLNIITYARDVWTKVHRETRRTYPVDASLMLSAALLYEYIDWACRLAYQPRDPNSRRIPNGPIFPYAMDLVTEYMQSAGWCPAELRIMEHSFTGLEMWRLSFLDVPHLGKDHSGCADLNKCGAYQIVESAYKTAHDPGGDPKCQCEFVYASQSELSKILLGPAEGIPLVQTSAPRRYPKDNRLYVELTPSRTDRRSDASDWVAISHVWSDGLGNNKDNAIPLCQFNRLCKLSSALPFPGRACPPPFWLDTLCFPLEPQDAYDKALIRMKESYEGSKAVLVLDGYLLGVQAEEDEVSMTEIMARIILCPWNRRLWTWQEAFLAQRNHLFFQFKDVPICDKDLLDASEGEWMTEVNQSMDFALSQNIYARFRDIRSRDDDRPIMERVSKAKDTLTFRSTSQGPDEVLCLGNILGVDTEIILKAEKKDWMQTFWENVIGHGNYHASMIFWDGPKLDVEGFRWAPATFMDGSRVLAQHQWPRLDGCVIGSSRDGLHVKLPSLVCSELKVSGMGLCYIQARQPSDDGLDNDLHFVLDLEDWSMVRQHQKVAEGFVVLLPWLWEHDGSQAEVQLAGRLGDEDDRLRLLSPGVLDRMENVVHQSGNPGPDWVQSYAAPEATWTID